MQTTIRKRTARISVVGLILLLGLGYPAVTFAASGSGTPPSTLNTCTKVRKALYGKTKVSASAACPTGEYSQSWISDNVYTWNVPQSTGLLTSGITTFPAGDTVSFVNGSVPLSPQCANVGSFMSAQLTVGGQVLAQWTTTAGPPTSTGPPVTLSSPSDLAMAISCSPIPDSHLEPSFNVTFSVTPSIPPVPYS